MKIHRKKVSFLLIMLLLVSALIGISIITVNGQLTPYTVNGIIAANSAVWHNIYDVKGNELVLISISGSDLLDTFLYYPNQTLCSSVEYSSGPFYQFNASLSGTYLLRISGWDGRYSVNYSISSSHSINNATSMTPYHANGTIAANGAVWHNIHNVNQNELVLISISGSEGLTSSIDYPNLTECASVTFSSGHVYQFNASLSGTYLLRISGWDGRYSVNYSISSSHNLADNNPVTPKPLSTVTPSSTTALTSTPVPTSPTPSSSTPSILLINATIGNTVTFKAPTELLNDSTDNFIWNFGDGKSITTRDDSVTHTYDDPGNFTVTLKIQSNNVERTVQTYVVSVTSKDGGGISIWMPIFAACITAGTTILVFFLNKRVKKHEEKPPKA